MAAKSAPDPDWSRKALLAQLQGEVQAQPETDLERAYYLAKHRSDLASGTQNLCKLRFANFLKHCVTSIDEAHGGEVRKWPWGTGADGRSWTHYWLDFEYALCTSKLLMIEKARRVLASWTVCAWDVWLAAGGQDPRWLDEQGRPVLMASDRNRQIIVAARKAQGFGGSEWFIERRIKALLDNFEACGGREYWPEFPRWTFKTSEIEFENGSRINGVPQGPDHTRGGAGTHLHCEEVAFWEQAKPTIGAALPTLRGGGHITLITTPQVGSYAKDIRDGNLRK